MGSVSVRPWGGTDSGGQILGIKAFGYITEVNNERPNRDGHYLRNALWPMRCALCSTSIAAGIVRQDQQGQRSPWKRTVAPKHVAQTSAVSWGVSLLGPTGEEARLCFCTVLDPKDGCCRSQSQPLRGEKVSCRIPRDRLCSSSTTAGALIKGSFDDLIHQDIACAGICQETEGTSPA